MKVNKAWIYIILICLAFLIHGEYYKTYFSLFVGFVGVSAGLLLCEVIIQILRNQRIKK
ncbi:hypothetical protein LLT5_02430 [Lactococcus cremoris subsp. cremoris TIFN5]|nr:hypothetical protein L3107_0916 [Lactococcus cremoris]EQC54500.1 hypothetical protein LLT5_02430 [Lactococcus cremoris subsp. cremoris TIFN5]EQC86299.1 hypothetical protein LLT1_02810 [Lactococcus cremoris subsp. cremoris TIFN1]MDM5143756.1 hypothetical protein [Lactococcus lactis]